MSKASLCSVLISLLFFTLASHAQLPDSIQKQLAKASHDSSRVRILINCCRNTAENDSLIPVYVNNALQLIDRNSNNPSSKNIFFGYKVDALVILGKYLALFKGDGEAGIKAINEATVLARSLTDKQRLANALTASQDMCTLTGDLPRLRQLVDSSIPLQKEINDRKGLVNAYCNLGNYFTGVGNSDSAILSFKIADSIAEKTKDKSLEATPLYAIGFGYLHKGSAQEALPYLYKSVKAFEEAGKSEDSYPALQAIGNVYSTLGEYSKAIGFFDKAITLATNKSDIYSLCNLYFYKGVAFRNLQMSDSSNHYLEQSVAVARQIKANELVVAALIKMGTNHLEQGDTLGALNYFRQSLDENKELQLQENLVESYSYIGLILLDQNKVDSAFYYGKLAEKIAAPLQFNSAHKQVEFLLSKAYERKGNYKDALIAFKNYVSYRDSIDNKKSFRTALEKQFQYEAEKKDLIAKAEQEKKDIEIKAQKNRLLLSVVFFAIFLTLGGILFYINRKRKTTLYKQNLAESEMKALRAQMNPHFMFNSLNAIQQMVLNHENDNAFKYLDTYSKLTRKILENSEKKWISLQDEIKFLELYLQIESLRFQQAFSYEINVDENISLHDNKVPAMIIQPLVENAIKHGLLNKAGEKKLMITFTKQHENGPLEVLVEDNGVGRELTAVLKNEEEHQSMSLSITQNRLRLLDENGGSKIVIEDLKNSRNGNSEGTRVKVIIMQPS